MLGSVAAAYVIGTLPSADLAATAAARNVDLRAQGSGNPGSRNVAELLGSRWGAAVMAADIAKGAAATHLGLRLAGPLGANLAGTAAVVGHCYPAWNGFRGGKGVATSIGQVLGTFPAYFPIDAAVAGATAALPGLRYRTFAATGVASLAWVGCATVWWRRQLPNAWGPPPTPSLPLSAAASSAVIAARFLSQPKRAEGAASDEAGS